MGIGGENNSGGGKITGLFFADGLIKKTIPRRLLIINYCLSIICPWGPVILVFLSSE